MDWRRKLQILILANAFMFRSFVCMCLIYYAYNLYHGKRHRRRARAPRKWSLISKMPDQFNHLKSIVDLSDSACISNLRMDRNTFYKLCYLLENLGGLQNERFVTIPEKVATFLLILAHHTKNMIVRHNFKRFGQTISKYFNQTLQAVIKISGVLLVEPQPVGDDCTTEPWKYFKGCLGALDGTYIEVHVRQSDQARYRSRKGHTAVNVLGVCNREMNFVYILSGWEGSTADSRVLRDALNRPHGLRVPTGNYYLCDCGYTNCEGFLTPYRGTKYHLQDWRSGPRSPQSSKELFNLRHAKAQNVIERAFGLLKNRWAILRSPSFYHMRQQNFIILACGLLHNFIRTNMEYDPLEEVVLNTSLGQETNNDVECVESIESSGAWNSWRDNLAVEMFNAWRGA